MGVRNVSKKGIISVVVCLIVGIILISFGIYLINCCSSTSQIDGDIWYYLVKYAGLHLILLGVGGVILVITLIGGLYLMMKSRH
jgi:hypothetical protein